MCVRWGMSNVKKKKTQIMHGSLSHWMVADHGYLAKAAKQPVLVLCHSILKEIFNIMPSTLPPVHFPPFLLSICSHLELDFSPFYGYWVLRVNHL